MFFCSETSAIALFFLKNDVQLCSCITLNMSTATTGTDAVPHFESDQQTDGSHRASKRPRNAINKRTRHKYEENRTVKAKVRISHTAKTELDKHKTETGKNEQDVASVAITTYLQPCGF